MKINKLEYRGYTGSICYSKQDDCYYGSVKGIKDLVSYEGKTLKELKKDFIEVVEDYVKKFNKDRKKGKITLKKRKEH